jgi:hypothetical protein
MMGKLRRIMDKLRRVIGRLMSSTVSGYIKLSHLIVPYFADAL